jgi:hypothetical protein
MEATKQTKMTKEDLHLSWKDKLNIIRDNRYFLLQNRCSSDWLCTGNLL